MSESHGKGHRLKSGAKRKPARDKIRAELGREVKSVVLGEREPNKVKGRGSVIKNVLKKANSINVLNPKTGKIQTTKIVTVVENAANRHYVRMNVLSKGAIVKTELGNARITSRPGQHGVVNGILV